MELIVERRSPLKCIERCGGIAGVILLTLTSRSDNKILNDSNKRAKMHSNFWVRQCKEIVVMGEDRSD